MGWLMDGLDTESYDRTYSDRALIQRIISYFRPHWKAMITVAVMVFLHSLTRAAWPMAMSYALDAITADARLINITIMVVLVLLSGALGWLFNFLRQRYSARAIGDAVFDLREDVFAAITQRDMSFYDETPTGKIVSRATSDTQDFANVVELTMNLLSQILTVVILSVVLVYINVWLTLLLLAMAPVSVFIALAFRRIARWATLRAKRVTALINANIQESISGISIAKGFRQEQALYNEFADINRQSFRVHLVRGITLNSVFPILNVTAGIGTAILLYTGGQAVLGLVISAGTWFLFMQAVDYFWYPLLGIASFWSQFQDGLAASERVFALIDAESKVVQIGDEPVPAVEGRIEFDRLRFSYTDKEVVLPDFSLTIEPGETVAIVGHTGAGKSSLARLVTRFYEFQGGQILMDGRDVRTLNLGQYRRHLGLVPQSPFLFSGTVADNIRYGRPDASDEEVTVAARQIGGGDWLLDLPNGLNTDVGERGASLSMGQRQLVALARVVLHDPAVFILDEATASVDPFTEAQIQEGLDTIMRDRTSIVIAHRLSTVKRADRTIVIQDGHIIEEGTHDALLAAGGHYAELYNTYFRHQSLEYIESFGREQVAAEVAAFASD
ncbi:MAG: ABC transporter ATP-binding protein/permease [Chloroflexi bacterium]|nr:ABC transporter ATP-binding protein/permease [Chloroflexota bacterium]MBU1751137.1 ABC transporter ATP-binding protein/permease [Chloroflexota bacterium]